MKFSYLRTQEQNKELMNMRGNDDVTCAM